jgi:transposase-like protein
VIAAGLVGCEASSAPLREQPRAGHTTNKPPVVLLVYYETRRVHSRVMPHVTERTLLPAIAEVMDPKRTWLYTDGHSGYRAIAPQVAGHVFVNRSARKYARGKVASHNAGCSRGGASGMLWAGSTCPECRDRRWTG